jgi:hypothetical protein
MTDWRLYIIDRKGHYYVGITTNLSNRMRQHGWPSLLYTSPPMTSRYPLKDHQEMDESQIESPCLAARFHPGIREFF